jgi:hypothetical protein
MRKLMTVLAIGCVCMFAVSAVYAGPGCGAKGHEATEVKAGSSCGSKATTVAESGSGCSSKMMAVCAKAGEEMPTMTAWVGDKQFECCEAAGKYAADNGGKVIYAVAGEKFESSEEAHKAFLCATDCHVKRFVSVAYEVDGKWVYCDSEGKASGCSTGTKLTSAEGKEESGCTKSKDAAVASASEKGEKAASCHGKDKPEAAKMADMSKAKKFRVAGHIYTSFDDAKKASERAQKAIEGVKMAYVVDGKKVECSTQVCPSAAKAGKVEYVVGEQRTKCETTAKLNLARAQVEAAKKSLDSMASL